MRSSIHCRCLKRSISSSSSLLLKLSQRRYGNNAVTTSPASASSSSSMRQKQQQCGNVVGVRRFQSTFTTATTTATNTTKSIAPKNVYYDMHNEKKGTSKKNICQSSSNKKQLSSMAAMRYDNDDDDDDDDDEYYESVRSNINKEGKWYSQPSSSPIERHCETCTCSSADDNDDDNETTTNTNSNTNINNNQINDYDISSLSSLSQQQPQEEELIKTRIMPCGRIGKEDENENFIMPPPLKEPKYSAHKRVLPTQTTTTTTTEGSTTNTNSNSNSLILMSSYAGRQMLLDSMNNKTCESYYSLIEHFINQLEPAYCGITSLIMVLNSMCIDPNIRWKGGWRYYGNEDVLLSRCCISKQKVERIGITLDEFQQLGKCQGLHIELCRPKLLNDNDEYKIGKRREEEEDINKFRQDILQMVQSPTTNTSINNTDNSDDTTIYPSPSNGVIVVSYSRSSLGQTGDGHFSPIAAYHQKTDSVLILDVARFKYSPYWVSVQDLYNAMKPIDTSSKQSRGWFCLYPPNYNNTNTNTNTNTTHNKTVNGYTGCNIQDEKRRPVNIVPKVGDPDICPIGKIKIEFCSVNSEQNNNDNNNNQQK